MTFPAFLLTLFLRHLPKSCWLQLWSQKSFLQLGKSLTEGYLACILVQKWTPHTPICSHIFSCFSCVFSYQVGDTTLKVVWQHCVSYLFSPVFQIHLALWTLLFTLTNLSSLFPTWIDPGLHTAFWKVVYKYCWIHLRPQKETKEREYELSLTLTHSKTQKFTEKYINIFWHLLLRKRKKYDQSAHKR